MPAELVLGSDYGMTPGCPVAVVTESRTRKGLHRHDCAELVMMRRGSARHEVEGNAYDMQAGDIFLIQGEQLHLLSEERGMQLSNLLYLPERLPALAALVELPGYRAFFVLEPSLRGRRCFRGCFRPGAQLFLQLEALVLRIEQELIGRQPGHGIMALQLLQELIVLISRSYAHGPDRDAQALVRLGDLLARMEADCLRPWTLAEIVSATGLARSTCLRLFHSATGTTPIDHLICLRIRHAMLLLRDTDREVTGIALDSGFSDSNYFARQFRRINGCTPTQWRRSIR